MQHIKRILILLICLIFISSSFIKIDDHLFSYADDNFTPLRQQSDMVIAFQQYCKSRDLTIEGSVADAVTTFTTSTFNSICNGLGINMTQLQAEIKAEYDQNGMPLRFLFTATGINAYNRIFGQFLQDNDLEVGEAVDKTIYSGRWFTDDDGYSCFITYINTTNTFVRDSALVSMGSTYRFNGKNLFNTLSGVGYEEYFINYKSNTYTYYINWNLTSSSEPRVNFATTSGTSRGNWIYLQSPAVNPTVIYSGDVLIIENNAHDLYLGYSRINTDGSLTNYIVSGQISLNSSAQDISIIDIDIYSPTINNNNYEGDTIINNYPDEDPDDPDPDDPDPDSPAGGTPPNWDIGGGDGTADDGDGNTWNIHFPDFELPDLNIDWSINGLSSKFPFSIPFDLVALVTVLNAAPETPRFDGTIDFGFTTWDYDLDFTPFNTVAAVFRTAELLLFIFGLIMITRSIIKG